MEEMHVLESLPAYALGSLDEAEAHLVAQHLGGCHICRSELKKYQDATDQLALSVPEAIPSPDLKRRLMQHIRDMKAPQSEPFRPPRGLQPAGGLLALLLVLGLAASNLMLWQRLNHLEMITGPLGMRAVALENTAAASQASGFVIISADGGEGVLVVDELPSLDVEHEYQLWLENDGGHTSGAVFSVDENGYRGMRIEAPQTLLAYSSVRVTIEPAGGSAGPSGETVLGGSLFNPK